MVANTKLPLNSIIGPGPAAAPIVVPPDLTDPNALAAPQPQTQTSDNGDDDGGDDKDKAARVQAAAAFVAAAVNDPTAPLNPVTPSGIPAAGTNDRPSYNRLKVPLDTSGPTLSASMEQRARDAVQYFSTHGWTQNQAIGIVGNLVAESGLRPDAVGDSGQAYGLAQMHKDRRDRLEAVFGKSFQDMSFGEQLQAVNYELQQGTERHAGNMIANTTTFEDAATATMHFYERCADQGKARVIRTAAAGRVANAMGVHNA